MRIVGDKDIRACKKVVANVYVVYGGNVSVFPYEASVTNYYFRIFPIVFPGGKLYVLAYYSSVSDGNVLFTD